MAIFPPLYFVATPPASDVTTMQLVRTYFTRYRVRFWTIITAISVASLLVYVDTYLMKMVVDAIS